MTTQTTLELNVNVTVSNTWTQVKNQATGSVYTVGVSTRANVRDIMAANLGANSVTFEYAISTTSTITDDEKKLPPITIPAGGHYEGSRQHTLPEGFGLWVRAVGTSPNLTVSAQTLEVAP